ncbi:MAG: hypothetical protein JWN48_5052 [Myxococcaceae bacterium]|nr:hypothetical protein [Myxococcaceae bacterium]
MDVRASLPVFDFAQSLPPLGLRLPARMTALPFGAGKLALVSPVPIDDALAADLARLGEVQYLIAPNLLHHLYLAAASQRYPGARVIAPAGLRAKRPDLTIHADLEDGLPAELEAAVQLVRIEGAPALAEHVFFHRATRTLVVTDLVFHVLRPQGAFTKLVLTLVGCRGKLAQSVVWRIMVRDRRAAAASVEQLLALPFETLVMAHGEVLREDARARLAGALSWLLPARLALPA